MNSSRANTRVFASLVVVAAAVVVELILIRNHGPWILVTLSGLLLCLSAALLALTLRGDTRGARRRLLLMTAAGALAFPVGLAVHNGGYALAMAAFGRDFWERIGMPEGEPVSFVLGVIVGPLVFVVGVVGTLWNYLAPLRRR